MVNNKYNLGKCFVLEIIILMLVVSCAVPIISRDKTSTLSTETPPLTAKPLEPVFFPTPIPAVSGISGSKSITSSNNISAFLPQGTTISDVSGTIFLPPSTTTFREYTSPTPIINSSIIPTISGSPEVISPSYAPRDIIAGKVYGYDPINSKNVLIDKAKILLNNKTEIESKNDGSYISKETYNSLIPVSVYKDGYVISTVDDVLPGAGRDIHLNSLNDEIAYSSINLSFEGKINPLQNPSNNTIIVEFKDIYQSLTSATILYENTNKYKINVRPRKGRTTTTGTILAYTLQTDNNLTQIKQYGYSTLVSLPTPIPTSTASATGSTSGKTDFYISKDYINEPNVFGEITVNLSLPPGTDISNTVLNVYMKMPTGEEFFVAKYNDTGNTKIIQQDIKVPKIDGTTFSIQAHAGNSIKGSDLVINNIKLGDIVNSTFLPPPKITYPYNDSSVNSTPEFSWEKIEEAQSYQLDLQSIDNTNFRWEGYTTKDKLRYPNFSFQEGILSNKRRYRLQLMACDFNFGSLSILSLDNKSLYIPDRILRIINNNDKTFNIKLANPIIGQIQKYRVSYDSVVFGVY